MKKCPCGKFFFKKAKMSFLPPKYAITDERMRVRTVNESATSFQLQWKWQRFPSRNFSLEFIGKKEREVIRKYWHVLGYYNHYIS